MAAVNPERLLAVIELQNAIAAAGMTADEVMHLVGERAAILTGASGALVALVEGDELVHRAVSRPGAVAVGSRTPRSGTALGRCVAEGTVQRFAALTDPGVDPGVDAERRAWLGGGALVHVPLLYGETAVGVLEVARARPFGDDDVELLRLLAQIVAIALHRAYTYPKPRLDNTTDPMTGLGNKRAFDERIQAELNRNRRYRHSFSLAMLELDGLESAIDRHGQAAGDEALREIGEILRRATRAIDGAFRIAADEFAIVMPGTSLAGAGIVADRCRTYIREANPLDGALVPSVGLVEARDESPDDLAARAIAAMSADKQAQRS